MKTTKIYLVEGETTMPKLRDMPIRKLLAKHLADHFDAQDYSMDANSRIAYLAWLHKVKESTVKTLLNSHNKPIPGSDIEKLVKFYCAPQKQ